MHQTHRRKIVSSFVVLLLLLTVSAQASSTGQPQERGKTAIVVASFGTTVPRALPAITNIMDRVRAAFPETEVRLTFTSNIIRKVWRKRQAEAQKWLDQGVPEEILYVQNIISTLGDLREDGYRSIIVQPTHMFYMEQSHDLESYIRGIGSIRTMKKRWQPFDKVVMGRPALGMAGDLYDIRSDVEAVVTTLADDAALAAEENAMLVYLGHGNEHWPTGIYALTQKVMREKYPEVETHIGVVEGHPALEDLIAPIKQSPVKKIILKPFMIVAGDHAVNDMAGQEEESWKSMLESHGYAVQPVLEGLGSNDRFVDIFVRHIEDAAKLHNIQVK